jgi:hypothetical protein
MEVKNLFEKVQVSIAKLLKSWHLQTSSYERTPELAHFTTKTLSGQHRPITSRGCYRASLRSRYSFNG